MSNITNFRFYHCYQKYYGLSCERVTNLHIEPYEINSRLLMVNKLFPEFLDPYILLYKYIPKKITIKKNINNY